METIKLKIWLENSLDACAFEGGGGGGGEGTNFSGGTNIVLQISDASTQLKLLDVVQCEFIPAITGGIFCNEMERKLIALPHKLDGLGIPIFAEISNDEFENPIKLTECLSTKITNQMFHYMNQMKKFKSSKTEFTLREQNRINRN